MFKYHVLHYDALIEIRKVCNRGDNNVVASRSINRISIFIINNKIICQQSSVISFT